VYVNVGVHVQRMAAGVSEHAWQAVLLQQRLAAEARNIVPFIRRHTIVPIVLLLGSSSNCMRYECDTFVVRAMPQCLHSICLLQFGCGSRNGLNCVVDAAGTRSMVRFQEIYC
jgi:hypothetical protein